MSRFLLIVLAFVLGSCRSAESSFAKPDPGLQRMITQPRLDRSEPVYAAPAQGRVLPAPRGVVPYRPSTAPPFERPLIDAKILALGKQRFETYCATCHGRDGYAQTPVRAYMSHPPTSLHSAEARALDPMSLAALIRTGKGWMPSYGVQLSEQERWAVVAWVKLLQRSQRMYSSALNTADLARLEEDAP